MSIIRLAARSDTEQLLSLHQRYRQDKTDPADIGNGFITVPYTRKNFRDMIERKEIVVARHNKQVIGYYLVNNVAMNSYVEEQMEIVTSLRKKGILPSSVRIAYAAQAVVEKEHRGTGLSKKMLMTLCAWTSGKYDLFAGRVSKENEHALTVDLKAGWEIMHENETHHFVFLDTQKKLTSV